MIDLPPLRAWIFALLFLFCFVLGFCSKNCDAGRVFISDEVKNKGYFINEIYPQIRKSECGKCEKLCHLDKRDRGGLTCVGVSERANPDWFVNELNEFDKKCKPYPVARESGVILCKTKLLEVTAKELLYKKYAKPFEHCERKAYKMIVDSSVLEGVGAAKRHLKKVGGCKNFNAKAFTESRIKRFKSLKQCPIYCKGWRKRAKRKLRNYERQKNKI